MPTNPSTCPNCGASSTGKFCSECGAAIAGGKCAQCQADLAAGAKFCFKCGTPVGAGAARKPAAAGKKAANAPPPSPAATGFAAAAPWAVAGIALVALLALVAKYSFGGGDAAVEGQQPLSPMAGGGGGGGPFSGGAGGASNVNINAPPRELADRLYNRVMRLDTENKKDSITFFLPMAAQVFASIPDPDADTHYDFGRMLQVGGMLPAAMAEADTILKGDPKNLLGLTLAMRTARAMGNTKEASAFAKRLLAAAPAEQKKKDSPGYQQHSADLEEALREAAK